MDWIFSLIKNKILLAILTPILTLAVGYGVAAYFRIGWMESKIETLKKENYEFQVHLANCMEVNEIATGQIRFAETQCRRLLKYVENMPTPRPSAEDDGDIDDLVNRLLGKTPSGAKAGTDGKGTGSTSP